MGRETCTSPRLAASTLERWGSCAHWVRTVGGYSTDRVPEFWRTVAPLGVRGVRDSGRGGDGAATAIPGSRARRAAPGRTGSKRSTTGGGARVVLGCNEHQPESSGRCNNEMKLTRSALARRARPLQLISVFYVRSGDQRLTSGPSEAPSGGHQPRRGTGVHALLESPLRQPQTRSTRSSSSPMQRRTSSRSVIAHRDRRLCPKIAPRKAPRATPLQRTAEPRTPLRRAWDLTLSDEPRSTKVPTPPGVTNLLHLSGRHSQKRAT
jgi:hypothetical protein